MPPTPGPLDTALHTALRRLAEGQSLDHAAVRDAFGVVMAGRAIDSEIGELLAGLRRAGESSAVIAGVVEALRSVMTRVVVPNRERLVDTCGTGGGRVGTLNVSTAAAFVVAGAGVPVAKHGNRSHTSRSGSADVLEALGISTSVGAAEAARVLDEVGIVFLFAPLYHPAMRHVAVARRRLGVPTVMNLVGPLANPALVERQVVGVADPAKGPLLVAALADLGARRAMVVHGEVGVDELAPVGRNRVWDLDHGRLRERVIDPVEWGLGTRDMAGTEGGEPGQNAAAIEALFRDPTHAAPALRATVILNAAAAIEVSGLVPDFEVAVGLATEALDRGAAYDRFDRLRRRTPFRTSE
jgi:anthranilate phosphoribosyltransferase